MLIIFQTVKQLLFTTIGFQRRSHLHINVNEVSSNHLFDLKTCSINRHWFSWLVKTHKQLKEKTDLIKSVFVAVGITCNR